MSPVIGFNRALPEHPSDLPAFEYAWLESPLEVKLVRWEEVRGSWSDPDRWPAGRLFGEAGEYRWQRLGPALIHGVLLLESSSLPEVFSERMALEKTGDASFVLWGDWVNPDGDPTGNPNGGPRFYAQEIPGIQEYPIDEEPKIGAVPRLLVRRYRDSKDEKGEFLRCVGLKLDPKEGDDRA